MDRRKVIKDGSVFAIKELMIVEEICRDPIYKIELCNNNKATDTMHLVVGKLIPNDPSLPYFIFRWDQKQDQFDVDVENVNNKTKKKFKTGENGYSGHHPKRFVDDKGRCMVVDVRLPNKKIFQGTIRVHVVKEIVMNIYLNIDGRRITIEKEYPFIFRDSEDAIPNSKK